MKLTLRWKVLGALIACSASFSSHAATAWSEGVDGDFSNDGLAPTAVTFALGHNEIIGTTGDAGQGIDRDYFTFTVPVGMVLTALVLEPDTSVSGSSSFIGLQRGPQLTVTPTGGGVQNLIGLLHYDASMAGADLFPSMLIAPTTAPLGSGAYSVWVQELGGTVPYALDFQIAASPVPVPAAAILLFSGVLGLGAMPRRRGSATAA